MKPHICSAIIYLSFLSRLIAEEAQQDGIGAAVDQPEPTQPGEGASGPTDDAAAPSEPPQLIMYGIGIVFGCLFAVFCIGYLFRKPSGGEKNSTAAAIISTRYERVATDDIERGSGGGSMMELSSRASSHSHSSTHSHSSSSSIEDEEDEKNWDDWETGTGGGSHTGGEFLQHSKIANSATAPISYESAQTEAALPSPPVRSSSTSIGSLGSLGKTGSSTGSLGKTSSRSVSPAAKKKRSAKPAASDSDDLFASIGISAAPTFKEATPSPATLSDNKITYSSGVSAGGNQKRLSDVVAEDDDLPGDGVGWADAGDDDFDI